MPEKNAILAGTNCGNSIKVLLVDDKEDYCKSLSGPARHKNIQIVYNLDWETGSETLKNDSKTIELTLSLRKLDNGLYVSLPSFSKVEQDQESAALSQ